jgi:hypothetical protein
MCATNNESKRVCVVCDSKLIGRSDKVFCGIKCKNKYHCEVRRSLITIDQETHKVLLKNYQILAGLMTDEKTNFIIDQTALQRKGFHFQFITSLETINNSHHFFIYDHSFEILKNKRISVTKSQDHAKVSPFLFKRWSRDFPEISK